MESGKKHELNNKCYRFEYKIYNKGFFDDFVDCTYILNLENNGRKNDIDQQLLKNIPTKKIYIVYNKGYKNCKKNLIEQNSKYDLIDFYLVIIKHSIENNFNNILILEDDFIFDYRRINDNEKNIVSEIKLFFDKNKDEMFYYNLGPTPIIIYPNMNVFNNNYQSLVSSSSHANIYTKKCQLDILQRAEKEEHINDHWDQFLFKKYKNYFHKYSICYQTFPITENQKIWFEGLFSNLRFNILKNIIKSLDYDKNPQPAHDNVMTFFFVLNYLIFILIGIIILYLLFVIFVKYK
jgi:hypothetical protein